MDPTNHFSRSEVGRLSFRCSETQQVIRSVPIFPDDEFDIGRSHVEQACGITDFTISAHHIRFRCLVYEEDLGREYVFPMIYGRVLSSNPVDVDSTGELHEHHALTIRKTDGDFLLNHGDVLHITPHVSLLFTSKHATLHAFSGLDPVQRAEIGHFEHEYRVSDRKLGFGGQARVFAAAHQPSGRQVACKILSLHVWSDTADRINRDPLLTPKQRRAGLVEADRRLVKRRAQLMRECDVLKKTSHPNIITLERVICTSHNIYIFEELITGGDLISYIRRTGVLSEARAAVIVLQVLKAIDYLHDNEIVHRDIKPENILMTSWRDGTRIVLTDFGQSRTIDNAKAESKSSVGARMQSFVGTTGYCAPEIIETINQSGQQRGYGKAIDIWPVGCITAQLLTGCDIFAHHSTESYAEHPDLYREPDWGIIERGHIASQAQSFIRGCIQVNEIQRLTAKQALQHSWLTNKHYAAELDAAYHRAVQDWRRRPHDQDLIQVIDTSGAAKPPADANGFTTLPAGVRSHHFSSPPIPSRMPDPAFRPFDGPTAYQAHKTTPLPSVSQDARADRVTSLVPSGLAQNRNTLAGATQLSNFTQYGSVGAGNNAGQMSIEAFAPPKNDVSDVRSPPSPLFPAVSDRRLGHTLTQGESMFIPPLPPWATKRGPVR